MPIKKMARTTGPSRELVRNVVRGLTSDVFRARQSSLEAYLLWLGAEWAARCCFGAELWRKLRASGFIGSLRVNGERVLHRACAERRAQQSAVSTHPLPPHHNWADDLDEGRSVRGGDVRDGGADAS